MRDLPETWRVGERSGEGKLGVIEDVENLSAENQIRLLAKVESLEQ